MAGNPGRLPAGHTGRHMCGRADIVAQWIVLNLAGRVQRGRVTVGPVAAKTFAHPDVRLVSPRRPPQARGVAATSVDKGNGRTLRKQPRPGTGG